MTLIKDWSYWSADMLRDIINDNSGGIISFLNGMEEPVILIDPDSNKIFFANIYAKKKFSNLEGRLCWEALGYQEPCCHNNSCLYKGALRIEKEENKYREHKITKINLSHKILIMESLRDINRQKPKDKKKNLKNSLISMASHELRTPLNIILSTLQLLEKYNENWKSAETRKHTRRIKKAASQINKLIGDMLLVEKVEGERLDFNPKPIDVVKLARTVIEGIGESIEHSLNITFYSTKKSITANVDEFLLTTILNNLLNNAVKYSRENGEIGLNLELNEKDIVFRITDKGIGIPKADKESLFENFYRASNVGRISGTGLGLAIVKDLVNIHKGSIDFISKENEGTTFTVKLPVVF